MGKKSTLPFAPLDDDQPAAEEKEEKMSSRLSTEKAIRLGKHAFANRIEYDGLPAKEITKAIIKAIGFEINESQMLKAAKEADFAVSAPTKKDRTKRRTGLDRLDEIDRKLEDLLKLVHIVEKL